MALWKQYKIAEMCRTISDTYKGNDEEVVLVNTSDVFDGVILNHERVPNKNLKGQFKKTFIKDDILYSEIRPANKRFAYVDFDDTQGYIASTKLMVLRANEDIIIPKYLFAILKAQSTIDELQLLAESRSGTFPQITFKSELSPMEFQIPDIETQKKIVKVMDTLEGKVKKNNSMSDLLKELLQVVFREWFVDTASEDWPVRKLGEFLELERGLSYKGKYLSEDGEGVPMLNLGNILPNSVFRAEKLKYYTGEYKEKHVVKTGDVIIANTDLTQDRLVLGSAIRVPDLGYSTIICSHHISIVRNSTISLNFVLGLLNMPSYRKRVAGFATGTTVLALPTDTILDCEFQMPPIELLRKYDMLAQKVNEEMEGLRLENERILELRDQILPRIMNSEIDVDNIVL